jgi:hypothetical protein
VVWRLLGGVLGSEVRRLVMRAGHDGSAAFTVMGSGAAADDVRQFLVWSADHGRASYTQRSHALGLAHVLAWLDGRGYELGEGDRGAVASYVAEFRRGEDGLGAARQARNGESPHQRVGLVLRILDRA